MEPLFGAGRRFLKKSLSARISVYLALGVAVSLDSTLSTNLSTTLDNVNHIGNLGMDGAVHRGWHRLAWSQSETDAMAYICSVAEDLGATASWDKAGNLHLTIPGTSGKKLAMGSHLDTVKEGGAYDGTLGVAVALEVLRSVAITPGERHVGFELIVMRGEENSFGKSLKGSAALFGKMPPEILNNSHASSIDGEWLLRDAMIAQGAQPEFIESQEPIISERDRGDYLGFLEVHIEQGLRLKKANTPLGIVHSIKGSTRPEIILQGEGGHTSIERDPVTHRSAPRAENFATNLVYSLERQPGLPCDFTIQVYTQSEGGGPTSVAHTTSSVIDIRSAHNQERLQLADLVTNIYSSAASDANVECIVQAAPNIDGLPSLDRELSELLSRTATNRGIPTTHLSSNASHDALMFGLHGIPTCMVFVCDQLGISHRPNEKAEIGDICHAATVAEDWYWAFEALYASRSR